MALELYHILIESNSGAANRLTYYHVFVWGLAGISTLGLGAGNMLGPPSPPPFSWCWVKDNVYARFFPFYIPFAIVALSIVILYTLMIRKVRNVYQGAGWGIDKRLFLRLGLYPAIFVITWVWGFVHRIEDASSNQTAYFIAVMHAVFTPLQGLLDAMLYGLTNTVIRDGCRHIICDMPCILSKKGGANVSTDDKLATLSSHEDGAHSNIDSVPDEDTHSTRGLSTASRATAGVTAGGMVGVVSASIGGDDSSRDDRMSLGPHTPPLT